MGAQQTFAEAPPPHSQTTMNTAAPPHGPPSTFVSITTQASSSRAGHHLHQEYPQSNFTSPINWKTNEDRVPTPPSIGTVCKLYRALKLAGAFVQMLACGGTSVSKHIHWGYCYRLPRDQPHFEEISFSTQITEG